MIKATLWKCFFLIMLLLSLSNNTFSQQGTLDLSFNNADNGFNAEYGANQDVSAIAMQSDGKILIAGKFTSYNGMAIQYLARLNASGTLDNGFNAGNSGLNDGIKKILVQPDGKIVVAGTFGIKRLNANGTPDAGFNAGGGPGANGTIHDVLILSNNKLIIGGAFTTYNGTPVNYLARLNTNGTYDATFNGDNTGADGMIYSLALQRDGRILIAGELNEYNDIPVNFICRLNDNGTLHNTFVNTGEVANSPITSIALQSDGKILAGGDFLLTRLNANGSTDASFNAVAANDGITERVNRILVQPDGKILIGWGEYNTCGDCGVGETRMLRRNADGTNDAGFKYFLQFVKENIYAIAIQPDGKILAGQTFIQVNARGYGLSQFVFSGLKNFRINRYMPDGSPDDQFNINPLIKGANRAVETVAVLPDGKLLVGGFFFSYNGEAANYLARINPDGSIDQGFNTGGSGPNNFVKSITVQPDGKIIVTGGFTRYNGMARAKIVRLNADGSIDPSFNSNANDEEFVNQVLLDESGKIYITKLYGQTISRLNADGSPDNSFSPVFSLMAPFSSPQILSLAKQPGGKILVGGYFLQVNNDAFYQNLVRLNADGSRDVGFNENVLASLSTEGVGPNDLVNSVVSLPDGKILIAGNFTSYRSAFQVSSVNRIARLLPNGFIDASFNQSGSGFDGMVRTVCVQPDGKLIVAGTFSSYNGLPANNIIRLNADGSGDDGFNLSGGGANAGIQHVAFQPELNKIMIGGSFTSFNGNGKNRIARISGCSAKSSITRVTACGNQLPYTWNGQSFASAGTYAITFNNINGCDSVATLELSVPVGGAENITGPVKVCAFIGEAGDTATYSIQVPEGSTITWSVSNAATMFIIGSTTTGTARIKFDDSFTTGAVYAKVVKKDCSISIRRSLSVNRSLPSTPGAIVAGTSNICPILDDASNGIYTPVSYTIRKVATATSYEWASQLNTTFIYHPNGLGENDTTVLVYFYDSYLFSTSTITVRAMNECGMSNARSLTVSRSIPSTPGAINGPVDVCNYTETLGSIATYSVTPIAGLNYYWTLPDGMLNVTGQNTPTVSFTYPDGFVNGIVSVVASNGCGASNPRKLTVRKYVAVTPGAITVVESGVCPARVFTYSIPAYPNYATSLVWTAPAGAMIVSGQGTTTVSVLYPQSAINGTLSVQSFNNCSASSIRKLTVKLPVCQPTFSAIGDEPGQFSRSDIHVLVETEPELKLFPNPAVQEFNLQVQTSYPEIIHVRIMDMTGKPLQQMTMKPGETIQFGAGLPKAVYLVEVKQGRFVKTVRAVKL